MVHCRPLIVVILSLGFCSTTVAETFEPHWSFVILLADDLGWTGLGCSGSDYYQTPHLDRLAARSMQFTHAYSACTVCSPTRAALMTGISPARLHLTDFIPGQKRPQAKLAIPDWTKRLEHRYETLPEALQAAGYFTAHIGKWHLDPKGVDASRYSPESHGFDFSIGKPAGTRGYHIKKSFQSLGESRSRYVTDYLTDQAVNVIDEHHDKRFFLYMAYHTPHTPIQGRADLVERFAAQRDPDAIHRNPNYAAMVSSLDTSVGRILDRLEQHGISDRTVIIFTSDNGGLTQRHGKHDGFTDNLPLRRGKGSAYEGGVRVPTIVHWPGVTKPGSVCSEPIITMDYYPTLLELASRNLNQPIPIDGVSLTALLKDPESTLDRPLFWHYPHYHAGGDGPYSAIRWGDWKLIRSYESNTTQLYHLQRDPSEQDNLADTEPAVRTRLDQRLTAWLKDTQAQLPTPNPNVKPRDL